MHRIEGRGPAFHVKPHCVDYACCAVNRCCDGGFVANVASERVDTFGIRRQHRTARVSYRDTNICTPAEQAPYNRPIKEAGAAENS